MRSLHLVYIVFFVLLGGVIAEMWMRDRAWRWLVLLLPICVGMYAADRNIYPGSDHLELPGRTSGNAWVRAFAWTRGNTPTQAVFALPPRYLFLHGEDMHGFRAIAQRSMVADEIKDSGVASVFPQVADEWERQQQMTRGWESYRAADFESLPQRSPATWVVVETKQAAGLDCPYRNESVAVCRLLPAR